VISPAGDVLDAFVTPLRDPYVTNICFGGPDGHTAYICSSGRGLLYSVRWPWPGLRLNFQP
jgi:gluconolactonase